MDGRLRRPSDEGAQGRCHTAANHAAAIPIVGEWPRRLIQAEPIISAHQASRRRTRPKCASQTENCRQASKAQEDTSCTVRPGTALNLPMSRRCLAVIVACACGGIPTNANAQGQPPVKASDGRQAAEAPREGPESLIWLRRIRSQLDRPAPRFVVPVTVRPAELPAPTFRVEVFAQRQVLPPFAATLKPQWQPTVPGGLVHAAFLEMVTPAQARPFAGLQNGQLAQSAASALASAAAMWAVKKGVRSASAGIKTWRVRRVQRQVEQELAAFKKTAAESGSKPAREKQ